MLKPRFWVSWWIGVHLSPKSVTEKHKYSHMPIMAVFYVFWSHLVGLNEYISTNNPKTWMSAKQPKNSSWF